MTDADGGPPQGADDDGELEPSELGTKKHWDDTYKCELANFADNPEDEGEVWFGEDALYRVLAWFDRNRDLVPLDAAILDLGCGNGVTCLHLLGEGFSDVTGVDYSPGAIELAKKIAAKHNYVTTQVKFEVCDILSDPAEAAFPLRDRKFDVLFDKGTYDAVSLDPEGAKVKRDKYIDNVVALMSEEAFLVITSCNWTKDELLRHFQKYFNLHETIPTPQFQFGGVVGNMVTSLILRKRRR